MQVDRGEDSSEFRHADPVKFGELVAGLGPGVTGWVSRKCLCETVAQAAPLRE